MIAFDPPAENIRRGNLLYFEPGIIIRRGEYGRTKRSRGAAQVKTTYGKKRDNGRKERRKTAYLRQLTQLLVCLVDFLVVFIGKEVWPWKVAETGRQLLTVIRANTDFRAAFTGLGQALSQEESVLGEIGEFCVSVFAQTSQEADSSGSPVSGPNQGLAPDNAQTEPLSENPAYGSREEQETAEAQPADFEADMQVGDIVQNVDYRGTELPEGYSPQWLYLGELETVTPVYGTVTSQFGYRDHPTIGSYAAHGGVDIAADSGTAVAAFAAGTVKSVGNSEDFGIWLQMEHANGVTTFYSHCSKLCVKEGDHIKAGENVAYVGSTGKSTGPHLHFEIRLNGVRLDPMHYIEPSNTL